MECVALKKGAWLKEETDYLEANWAEMTDKAIGKVLNRTTGAVFQKKTQFRANSLKGVYNAILSLHTR
jgi:hypothetical protein